MGAPSPPVCWSAPTALGRGFADWFPPARLWICASVRAPYGLVDYFTG
ncbi:hypothetical protein ACRCUN_10800 [Mycobacterium sp. LTG2003]